MKEILVVANRTLGGAKLLEAVRERAAAGAVRFRLVVPQSKPSAGLVIYDEAVRESAQVRVDLALSVVAAEGIEATGEVGDADPFLATMDAVAERRPDAIIVSTHPATTSGWLRRDLVERIENASGLPVAARHRGPRARGAAVQGDAGGRQQDLQRRRAHRRTSARRPPQEGRHLFIAVVPQLDGSGRAPPRPAHGWRGCSTACAREGLLSSGMIGDPDPYTATMNALELFHVDDVVISTLPGRALRLAALGPDRAGPRRHVGAGRARGRRHRVAASAASGLAEKRWRPPASHAHAATATLPSTTGRRPPTSARAWTRQLLGMLLFIISEIMVFGAFFTAYFFIRIAQGEPWPRPGTKLPVAVAGVNTAILVSSSFTLHWAETVRSRRATAWA